MLLQQLLFMNIWEISSSVNLALLKPRYGCDQRPGSVVVIQPKSSPNTLHKPYKSNVNIYPQQTATDID